MSDKIRVSEIFGPTIQGEGPVIGQPTVFVRTGGCDYRCSWCDSLHAVDREFRESWTAMTAEEIFEKIQALSSNKPLLVSLSGGNPAIHDLKPLIDLGHSQGYRFVLETQGSVSKDWFTDLDILVLSPKPPSSGMETDWGRLSNCIQKIGQNTDIAMKIVVFDKLDYEFAKDISARHPNLPLYLQPGNHTPPPGDAKDAEIDMEGINARMRWLVEQANEDQWFNVRILPQLHVMLWGNMKGV